MRWWYSWCETDSANTARACGRENRRRSAQCTHRAARVRQAATQSSLVVTWRSEIHVSAIHFRSSTGIRAGARRAPGGGSAQPYIARAAEIRSSSTQSHSASTTAMHRCAHAHPRPRQSSPRWSLTVCAARARRAMGELEKSTILLDPPLPQRARSMLFCGDCTARRPRPARWPPCALAATPRTRSRRARAL
jgi:hypothetical protein